MVSTLKWNEAGPGDTGGHPSAGFKRHPGIVPRVHDQRRRLDLSEERGHIYFAGGQKTADGICRRTGNPLQLIEPVGLLLGARPAPWCRPE